MSPSYPAAAYTRSPWERPAWVELPTLIVDAISRWPSGLGRSSTIENPTPAAKPPGTGVAKRQIEPHNTEIRSCCVTQFHAFWKFRCIHTKPWLSPERLSSACASCAVTSGPAIDARASVTASESARER